MKYLKFKSLLVPKILDGSKTVTWKLFDDKNLTVGDELEFLNSDTGKKFGRAKITHIREKNLGDVEVTDFLGHEQYKNKTDMLVHYQQYYGDRVSSQTPIKMITFTFYADRH